MSTDASAVDGVGPGENHWETQAAQALNVLSTVFNLETGTLSADRHAHRPQQPPQAGSPLPPSPPPPTPERAGPAAASASAPLARGASERKRIFTTTTGGRMWLPNSYERKPVSSGHASKRASKQPVGVTPTMLAAAAAPASTATPKR